MRKKRHAIKTPWLFITLCIAPAILLTLYFIIWPAIQVLRLSFTDATTLSMNKAQFVGLKNFINMFTDKRFVDALINTAKLLVGVPAITIFFALLLAFTVTQSKLRERGLYRTVFFFPSIVSMTVIGIVFYFLFKPDGLLNAVLTGIGLKNFEAFTWTANSQTAIWTIAAAFVWQSAGYFMVMHIAAIDSISESVYEAATIDGAGAVAKLFLITIPLIKNIVGITLIFSVSGILDSSFTLSRIMLPQGKVDVLLSLSYKLGYEGGSYGYAMAITAFTLALAIGLSALSRLVTSKNEDRS